MNSTRLGNCQICLTNQVKYRCPKCSTQSCSLPCLASHKSSQLCDGIASPIHSQRINADEWTWGALMRDQSYISSVSRLAEEKGKLLAEQKLIPGQRVSQSDVEREGTGRLDEKNEKEDALVREAGKEGVELVLVSKGMSKRQRNSSRWDPK